ncbi:MAG: anaerobic ribonucleoside-triphosphate reductase activating protein [Lachnospiraceae bacterium]|nr:anaerobic ribonucleoside-triphosphate reductase activating protein [Lachnospiraceae bacterium]
MLIHGLQKMTLLDFPGRVACTVFLGGCDLRCPFCHNFSLADGSAPAVMDDAALLAFLEKRRGLLDGVAFTGGEPLLRPDLPELLRAVRERGFAVKLDTNGTHPSPLAALLSEGLVDYVAMDLKNSFERYAETCGLPFVDPAPLRESIRLLMNGPADYEFRTTVVAQFHDEESLTLASREIAGARRYFLQVFADRESVPRRDLTAPSREDLLRYLSAVRRAVPEAQLRGI